MTPAQRNKARKLAEKESASQPQAGSMAGATQYELQLAQLAQHRARLKQIQSVEGKVALKRELLPEYRAYVEGVLAGGRGAQDEVLTTLMLWCLDVGDFDAGLDIADYVLKHKLVMPDRFARTTGTLIAEEVADAALKAFKASSDFGQDIIERTLILTSEQDMPDEVRAKLHLALGRSLMRGEDDPSGQDVARAATLFRRAIELHENCGAKKDLERAERLLKKHAPADSPATTGTDQQPPG